MEILHDELDWRIFMRRQAILAWSILAALAGGALAGEGNGNGNGNVGNGNGNGNSGNFNGNGNVGSGNGNRNGGSYNGNCNFGDGRGNGNAGDGNGNGYGWLCNFIPHADPSRRNEQQAPDPQGAAADGSL